MEKKFCGYSVYEPDKENLIDAVIFVAVDMKIYPEISRKLEKEGLTEFEDYIYYEWLFKNVVLLQRGKLGYKNT